MSSPDGVIGIVLAGGKSSRMGGGDKALLPLGGRPLLAHVVERLRPQAKEVAFPPVEFGGRAVDPFFNVNRPEDLAEAEVLLSATAPAPRQR